MISAAIIGAGISGVSAGKMIKDRGHEVSIYEMNKKPGGLVRCDWIDGNLFHRVGGHVFNSKIPSVLDWFWSFFDREKDFLNIPRKAGIYLDQHFYGYPIENHIFQFNQGIIEKSVRELISLAGSKNKDPMDYSNFESFLKGNFGETLYDLYFGPYNKKIWNTDLSEVPMQWLEGKLPMPNYQKIIASNIARNKEAEMVHSSFFYPRKGGSQFIVNQLAEGLNIKTGFRVDKLEFKNKKWVINGEGSFNKIIYTGDIRKLPGMFKSTIPKIDNFSYYLAQLKSNSTSNALCYTDNSAYSWLYLPDPDIKAHRIIYTGNFSSNNNDSGGRKTCVVEFSGQVDEKEMRKEIDKLPGDLQIIASNFEPNSYVIQDYNTRNVVEKVKNILAPKNFYLCGRFAEWEYYNMDMAIYSASKIIEKQF